MAVLKRRGVSSAPSGEAEDARLFLWCLLTNHSRATSVPILFGMGTNQARTRVVDELGECRIACGFERAVL
jgi:hypothetical protein